MAASYYPTNQDGSTNPGHNIIKHPLYFPRSSAWLDLKVFYVRLSNCDVDDSAPEHLMLNHIPLTPDTVLEVNGRRSGISTEFVSSTLRRDRVDKKSEEVIFISTDSIRVTGSVRFEVIDGENMLLWGVLELLKSNGLTGEQKNSAKKWSMKCQPVMSEGSFFLKGKQYTSPEVALPTIEVYVAGCFSGSAIILTKTLQLGIRKKKHVRLALESIPENEPPGAMKEVLPKEDQELVEYEGFAPENDVDIDYNSMYGRSEYMEGEDGELSWFNAGVRVGVGLGLGICLGIGVGAGLLLQTYKAAARKFRSRLL
ncbi:uncharacterized protein At1g01500-like isoform X2 [Phalaenopsis equestris]|nr:uncharacterized protein At1g01500-like isoform X2 [Phalaenopsis equestris]XP_020591200.1 uncharacterized protein At1g01500-like isoform X2 [Phalaenopsis equestris]